MSGIGPERMSLLHSPRICFTVLHNGVIDVKRTSNVMTYQFSHALFDVKAMFSYIFVKGFLFFPRICFLSWLVSGVYFGQRFKHKSHRFGAMDTNAVHKELCETRMN